MSKLLELGFDINGLSDLQLGQMWYILNSPAYEDMFEPYLTKMRDRLNRDLLDRSSGRKDEFPDDYIAGYICAIDGLLAFFRQIIEETKIEQVTRAMAQPLTPEETYEKLRQEGKSRPSGQTVQPDDQPLKPEDDY